MRVLLIEDDARIGAFVTQGLTRDSHEVEVATDGPPGLELALNRDFDVIILDLFLPAMGGEKVLEELRRHGRRTPVLVLTARDDTATKVHLLDLGADDYLTKPFAYSELMARVRALLRRYQVTSLAEVRIGDLSIDPIARRVRRGDQEIELTTREFALLYFLAQNEGHVVTRRTLAQEVWKDESESYSNVIDVHMNRLRNKIDRGNDAGLLHTVRGVGYVLRAES